VDRAFAGLTPAQESALLTLYLRALDFQSPNPILGDRVSAEVADAIDYEFATRQKVQRSLVLDLATRTHTLDRLIRSFTAAHPDAVVLDLGCGLDPRAARCSPPGTVDWYDIDFPAVAAIRAEYLPGGTHVIGADLMVPEWLNDIPADRPTMIVADGLMAFLTDTQYQTLTGALTTRIASGEFAFNAYTRLVLKIANYSSTFKALGAKSAGGGIDDPHEPEHWKARLTLIEELLLTRAPDVDKYPQPLRWFTRLCSHSTRISRHGNRVLHYRF
jgi:O-methyltransferase involved in polyketide biosynthesis